MEEELDVEFLLEKVGAALGVAEIFSDIATGFHLKCDGATLKGGAQAENTLAVGMIKSLSDPDDGGKTARDAFVIVVETGISGVMAVGF